MNFKHWILLTEAKKDIQNLGYPESIAKIFYKKFDKLAPLLSKWFRDYTYPMEPKTDWWRKWSQSSSGKQSLYDLTYLHDSTKSIEDYEKALKQLGIKNSSFIDLDLEKETLESQIENWFLLNSFFDEYFIKNILSKKITDISVYKNLSFQDARNKYDQSNIFQKNKIIKSYENGFKWIDVGIKCSFLGRNMKNCGSGSIYSEDPDKTMLALFGETNKPHVVLVYSPNDKTISGIEGIAGTGVKDKYHSYVLDLSKILNAPIELNHNKSQSLKLKYILNNQFDSFEDLAKTHDVYEDEFFKFVTNNKTYYASKDFILPKIEFQKASELAKKNNMQLSSDFSTVFYGTNKEKLEKMGIKYINVQQDLLSKL